MQAVCVGPFTDRAIEASDDHTRTIRHEHLQLLAGARLLSAYLETCNSNAIAEEGRAGRVITIKLSPGLQFAVPLQSIGKIVNRQIVGYLNDFHVFPDVQSAYRRGHATETAVCFLGYYRRDS